MAEKWQQKFMMRNFKFSSVILLAAFTTFSTFSHCAFEETSKDVQQQKDVNGQSKDANEQLKDEILIASTTDNIPLEQGQNSDKESTLEESNFEEKFVFTDFKESNHGQFTTFDEKFVFSFCLFLKFPYLKYKKLLVPLLKINSS